MNTLWNLNLAPPVRPTIDENLLLSDAIEFNWKNNPTYPFYTFADPQHGVQFITHLEFGRAAHRVAHLLRPVSTGHDGEVVAIIAHTDTILFQAIVAGLIIAGLVPFPIVPRIPAAAVAEMLVKTSCHRVLTTTIALQPLIHETKAHLAKISHELDISEIPSLNVVYPQLAREDVVDPFEPYPLPRRPSITDTCIIVNSSGTTGFPKAIAQTHLHYVNTLLSPELKEHDPPLLLGLMALPAFSAYAITLEIFQPAFALIPAAVFPPSLISPGGVPMLPSPQNVIEHAQATNANALFVVPLFIEAWSRFPKIIDYLKGLAFVGYAGLRLLPKIGNQLTAAGVQINAIYGGTEIGATASFLPNGTDWEYVWFFDHVNVRWIPQCDGAFECQFLRCEKHRPLTNNLPDVEGFATGDIFKPHPTKKGLWKNVGRMDEVIVQSSGKKTIPGPIEDIILSDSLVQAVILFGQAHEKIGVLIELKPEAQIDLNDQDAISRLRDELWPIIEEANHETMEFSQISKEMILFTSTEKPLPLTIKRTVMRKQALDLYASEILELYTKVESNIAPES